MLLGLFAAAAVAAPQLSVADDQDLRCMMAMSYSLALIDEQGVEASEEERSGLVALVMYYVGKIDGRTPDFDYAGQVTRMVQSPGYEDTGLVKDLTRCADEAQERGRTLKELSEQIQELVPLIEARRG